MSLRIAGLIMLFSIMTSASYAKQTITIAGAGPSAKIVNLFFENFSKQPAASDYNFVVPQESIKHAGGIKHSFKNLFGRTGRPLNTVEMTYGRNEIFLAMMPIVFATGSEVKIPVLSMYHLQKVFRKEITNWSKLGGPDAEIVTVGREPTEALFTELKRHYTFFIQAEFDKILNKDDEVVSFLESPQGRYAISFGAKINLTHLNQLHVKEELKTGVRLGLVYGKEHEDHPLVLAVKKYALSEEWRSIVRESGAHPVD